MTRLKLADPPDDDTILQRFDDSLDPDWRSGFSDLGKAEVVDHDYSERQSLVQITLQKWVDW